MARYAIWDKKTDIITPIGEVLSPEEWMKRYPVARIMTTLCGAGTINGSFFGVFANMKEQYEMRGCDFSDCNTEQEMLDKMEIFDNEQSEKMANDISVEADTQTRIADALEDLVALQLADV